MSCPGCHGGRGGQPLLPALRPPDRDGHALRALPGRAVRGGALLLELRPGGARRLAPALHLARPLRRRLHEPGRRLDRVPHLQRPSRFLRGGQCHPLSELRLEPPRHRPQAGAQLLGRSQGEGRGRGRRRAHRPAPGARGRRPALLRALLPADRPRLPVAGRAAEAGAGELGLPDRRREPGGRRAQPVRDRDPRRRDAELGRRRPARPEGRRHRARAARGAPDPRAPARPGGADRDARDYAPWSHAIGAGRAGAVPRSLRGEDVPGRGAGGSRRGLARRARPGAPRLAVRALGPGRARHDRRAAARARARDGAGAVRAGLRARSLPAGARAHPERDLFPLLGGGARSGRRALAHRRGRGGGERRAATRAARASRRPRAARERRAADGGPPPAGLAPTAAGPCPSSPTT